MQLPSWHRCQCIRVAKEIQYWSDVFHKNRHVDVHNKWQEFPIIRPEIGSNIQYGNEKSKITIEPFKLLALAVGCANLIENYTKCSKGEHWTSKADTRIQKTERTCTNLTTLAHTFNRFHTIDTMETSDRNMIDVQITPGPHYLFWDLNALNVHPHIRSDAMRTNRRTTSELTNKYLRDVCNTGA